MPITSPERAAAQAVRTIALQMLEERGRGAVLVGVARVDAALEGALNALRKLRNTFAHSAASASLSDPAHSSGLERIYSEARANPLWAPLETALAAQPAPANGALDPALRDYILLVTILVAFLEVTAQQLQPMRPPVVMGLCGVTSANR
jgi:hypothetical protein